MVFQLGHRGDGHVRERERTIASVEGRCFFIGVDNITFLKAAGWSMGGKKGGRKVVRQTRA